MFKNENVKTREPYHKYHNPVAHQLVCESCGTELGQHDGWECPKFFHRNNGELFLSENKKTPA